MTAKQAAAGKPERTRVYLEAGARRVFAMALDWPGWGRSGKTPEDALSVLGSYAERYAKVVRMTEIDFPAGGGRDFTVLEEIKGNQTTDFGAPACFASADTDPLRAGEGERVAAIVRACWDYLDSTAAKTPAELRKGPRGGGRDRDKMLDHVLGTEAAYARKIGVKHRQPAIDDTAAIAAMRADILEVLAGRAEGTAPVAKGWPIRYTARRIAWHALDHAWEMEDRTD